MLRLLVLDDESITGLGIAELLRGAGFSIVASVQTTSAAIAACRTDRPDVVVSDVMLDGRPSGLELPRLLADEGLDAIRVVYLSSYVATYFVGRAREAGAAGYLLKSMPLKGLVGAIEAAACGQSSFPVRLPIERRPSEEELMLITLLAAGFTSGEVAARTRHTEKAVEMRLARLYERYGARAGPTSQWSRSSVGGSTQPTSPAPRHRRWPRRRRPRSALLSLAQCWLVQVRLQVPGYPEDHGTFRIAENLSLAPGPTFGTHAPTAHCQAGRPYSASCQNLGC